MSFTIAEIDLMIDALSNYTDDDTVIEKLVRLKHITVARFAALQACGLPIKNETSYSVMSRLPPVL